MSTIDLPVAILRPSATQQAGTAATIVPSGTVHGVLSDSSDTSYVQILGRCRVGAEMPRVTFPTPSLPAGSKVVSVKLRSRKQSVTVTNTAPRCFHEFRCLGDLLAGILGAVQTSSTQYRTQAVQTNVPVTDTQQWVETIEWDSDRGPGGIAWSADPDGNLASFQYALGREDDSGVALRISELYLDVTYQRQNTVTVSLPTGTVTTTCRPDVAWSLGSSDSIPQTKFQVKVFSQAQHDAVGFDPAKATPTIDSGVILGEDLAWTLNADLVNGLWYAYLYTWAKFDGPGEFPSTVGTTSWTQNITGAPNATLTASPDATNYRVALIAAPGGPTPVTTALAWVRSIDAGNTWQPVRGGLLKPATGLTPITVYDNEVPFDPQLPTKYKVLAYGTVSGVLLPAADYSPTRSVTVRSEDWVLSDPRDFTTFVRLPVKTGGIQINQKGVAGVFWPVGSDDDIGVDVEPFVVQGVRYSPSGTLDLFWDDDDDWATFQALDQRRRTLLLRNPTGDAWYVAVNVGGSSGEDPGWKPEPIPGDPTTTYYREHKLAFTSTRKPPVTS